MTVARLRALLVKRREALLVSFWSLCIRVAGVFSAFALGVLLARVLGPAEFGAYGLVISVTALAVNVSLLGTPLLAVRELSICSATGDWARVKGIIYRFGMATGITAATIGVIAVVGAGLIGDGLTARDKLMVLQGALLTPLMVLTALYSAELRGLGALTKGQILDIVWRPAGVFVGSLAIVLIGLHLGAPDVLWLQIALAAFTTGLSHYWVRRALPHEARALPRDEEFKWIRTALPFAVVDALRQLDGVYGMVLMGWFATGVELGVFRVAMACGIMVGIPLTIVHVLFAPAVSRMNEFQQKEELQEFLSLSSLALTAILALVALASWFIGKPAIELVFGVVYGDAWLPLFLICCGQLVFAFCGMGPVLLAMCNGERHLTKIYAVSVGCALAAAIPLTQKLGASGAAVATIISATMISALSWRYARKTIGVDITFLPLLFGPPRVPKVS